MAKVYAFVADGMEEVECLAVCDLLIRAGIDVKLVSIMGRKEITGSHGFKITADCVFEEITDDADVLFLPGGMPGTRNLTNHTGLTEMLKAHAAEGKRLAAICAAPSVLGKLGILEGKKATCYPGFEEQLSGAVVSAEKSVVDGNVTTGKGMGAAIEFSLALIAQLADQETADKIGTAIIY